MRGGDNHLRVRTIAIFAGALVLATLVAAFLATRNHPQLLREEITRQFWDAVHNGRIESVRELLEREPSLSQARLPESDWTSLHVAAKSGSTGLVDVLMAHGADVNAKTTLGETPLSVAIKSRQVGCVAALLAGGADYTIRDESMEHPFLPIDVVWRQYRPLTLAFLANGVDIETKDERGYTMLREAADRQHIPTMRVLLEFGADPQAFANGMTARERVRQWGDEEAMQLFGIER